MNYRVAVSALVPSFTPVHHGPSRPSRAFIMARGSPGVPSRGLYIIDLSAMYGI